MGFCICAVACTSCSVDKHMERKTVELMDKMAAIPNWDELPRREISWDTAMAVMMEGNLDLKRSEQALRATERSVISVYTQVIPGVNLDWMLTKELSELTRVTAQDVEYNTNILFNMPSLTQIPLIIIRPNPPFIRPGNLGDEKGSWCPGCTGRYFPIRMHVSAIRTGWMPCPMTMMEFRRN